MEELNQPIPESEIVNTVEEAVSFAATIGYPVIVRPAFYSWWHWWWYVCQRGRIARDR